MGNGGKGGGMLDRHVAQQIHGTKSTKSCQINRSQKILRGLFVGDFRNWEEHNKNKLENKGVGLQFCDQPMLMIP